MPLHLSSSRGGTWAAARSTGEQPGKAALITKVAIGGATCDPRCSSICPAALQPAAQMGYLRDVVPLDLCLLGIAGEEGEVAALLDAARLRLGLSQPAEVEQELGAGGGGVGDGRPGAWLCGARPGASKVHCRWAEHARQSMFCLPAWLGCAPHLRWSTVPQTCCRSCCPCAPRHRCRTGSSWPQRSTRARVACCWAR